MSPIAVGLHIPIHDIKQIHPPSFLRLSQVKSVPHRMSHWIFLQQSRRPHLYSLHGHPQLVDLLRQADCLQWRI